MTARLWVYMSVALVVLVGVVMIVLAEGPTGASLHGKVQHALSLGGRLLLALGLTTAVGLEREARHKPAGVRTITMVGLGACIVALAGESLGGQGDTMSRVVQGVVTGIGFLGAGTIMKEQFHVEGLTTAATLWVAAGIGLCCGVQEYLLAVLGTLAVFVVLVGLKAAERTLRGQ